MSAPSASMEQTRALQRPHNTFALTGQCKKNDRTIRPQRPHDSAPTTARFSSNDRTIQPHRLHPSRRVSRRLFPIPFRKDRQTKARMLRAFKKTFRPLRENISTYETKRFGVSGSLRQKDTDDKKQYFSQKKKHFIWNLIFSFYICGKKQTKHSFMKTTMVNTFFWWRHLQPLRS